MTLCVLMYLCLLGLIHSASGVHATLINDAELSGTDTTPYVTALNDNITYTSIETETNEWDTTTNVSTNSLEITKSKLDELFDRAITACHSFFQTGNSTMLLFTINLTKDYEEISKNFLKSVKLQNLCQNSTTPEEHECDETWEYKAKLEIAQILSNELHKLTSYETEFAEIHIINDDSEQNNSKGILSIFDELLSIVKLNKELKELLNVEKRLDNKRPEDFDNVIKVLNEVINTTKEILHTIENSKNIKSLFHEEYSSKLYTVRRLLNKSRWKDEKKRYEEKLTSQEYKVAQHKIYDTVRLVVMPVGFGMIFILGLIGNGVLLIVFINHKDMRTAPNVMIINLTIADTLGVIINLLVNILTHTITFTWGHAFCQMYHFITRMIIGVSIYSVVAISIQRFVVLTDFFKPDGSGSHFFGKHKTFLSILLVWGFATGVPTAYTMNAAVDPECNQIRTADEHFNKILAIVNYSVTLVLPFVIIAITSGLTSWHLKYTVKNMPGEGIGHEKVKQARVVSANIFVALIIVFAICYIPMFCLMLYITFGPEYTHTVYYIHVALFWLMYCISGFNPIVLYIGSSNYRKKMNRYLSFRFRPNRNKAI